MSHTLGRTGRQAALNTVVAGGLAAGLLWFGPPGTDLAAHVFQLNIFAHHGFTLWTNYWYAGRYTFVGYSLLYYPLAALLGIKVVALLSVATAGTAFTVLARRTWGESTLWSTRLFAVVAAGSVLTAAFPYGLGLALALWALTALGRRRFALFGVLMMLSFAASPLAFLFLMVILAALAATQSRVAIVKPAALTAATLTVGLLLWRLFPDHGRFPFGTSELLAALVFCAFGAVYTWHVERARILRAIFTIYGALCMVAYLVPTGLGENVARLRYVALPIIALTLSLRRWRPLPVSVVAFVLALSWNVMPIAYSLLRSTQDASSSKAYWQPALRYLHGELSPSYRVEVVSTTGHWEAAYFAGARIPIVRGWFRQDDFPQNEILYDPFGSPSYVRWLHGLGVRYVVLSDATPDYSSRVEAELLASGRSGLQVVQQLPHLTIFSVPDARSIVTGPGHPRVDALGDSTLTLTLDRPGTYRIAMSYTPYLAAPGTCITETSGGLIELHARKAGNVRLAFAVTPSRAFAALAGTTTSCPER